MHGTPVAQVESVLEQRDDEFDFSEVETTSSPVVSPASGGTMTDLSREATHGVFWRTGLRGPVLLAIFAISTIAFFFWGGALWRVPPGTSHVARIAGSYLIVVPLVAAALAGSRRWNLQHLLGSVAAIWSAKLVITATSYMFVAPGSATEYAPARTWESNGTAPAAGQSSSRSLPSPTDRSAGISGVVLERGAPVVNAAVVLGDFESTNPVDSSRDIPLAIEQSRYGKSTYLASPRDRLLVENRDGVLHTIRFLRDANAVANVPIPPGPPRPIAVPRPGAYEMSCENHASERALLVVADRESITVTDSGGRFELRELPAGESDLVVLQLRREPFRQAIHLAPGQNPALSIELR